MTGWGNWSNGNFSRSLNLTIRKSGMCTTRFGECAAQTSLEFWDKNRLIRPCNSWRKRKHAELWSVLIYQTSEENWKRVKREKITRTLLENWKMWNMKVTVTAIVIDVLSTVQRIGTGTGGLGNLKTSKVYSNYSIVRISQNAEKSHGD